MRCPKCSHLDDKVIDSRSARTGSVIRRRRVCLSCGHRFTTYEEVIKATLMVVKRDGRHEELNRAKLLGGVARACEKRPISPEQLDQTVDSIIERLENENEREVDAQEIGGIVMEQLEKLDDVAYVRFASVYKRFRDASDFQDVVQGLTENR